MYAAQECTVSQSRLKEISTLKTTDQKNNVFLIDLYQRGYRWTKREAEALLEDIAEFMNTQSDGFYCLQPLTVNKRNSDAANDYWNVIDGQQRLTTIYLIYLYWYHKSERLPFQLDYPDRPEMKELLSEILTKDADLSLQNKDVSRWTVKDINCFYMWEVYQIIKNWFQPKTKEFIEKFQKTLQEKVQVIWYDLEIDSAEENKVFRSMNSGRIFLSNDELIKGLLLRRDNPINDNFRAQIAFEWHLIESFLADDRLFACLVEKQEQYKYVARIGLVFDVLAQKYNKENKLGISDKIKTFSFDVFDKYLKQQNTTPEALQTLWKDVNAVAAAFKTWASKPDIYNKIGFLVNRSFKHIAEIWRNYNPAQPEEFKAYLQSTICSNRQLAQPNSTLSYEQLNDLIHELKHNEDNKLIHHILLLYNIAYLQQQGYFDFDQYQKTSWNLEDINATADKELKFSNQDNDENPRKQWLQDILALQIAHQEFKELQNKANEALAQKTYLQQESADFKLEHNSLYLQVIRYFCGGKESDWGNTLGNLTLLDEQTNKHYHNDLFPCKREKILSRLQSGRFIPPATLKVFMKSFPGAGSVLMWTDEDAQSYQKDMLDTISSYLGLEIPAQAAEKGLK